MKDSCPLCPPPERSDVASRRERVLFADDALRVILAAEPGFPGFCRVVWREHVAETTDLHAAGRERLLAAVLAVEAALREVLAPDKVNLASLGNVVPHLHWHVVPRWRDDPTFPGSPWSARLREPTPREVDVDALAVAIRARIATP